LDESLFRFLVIQFDCKHTNISFQSGDRPNTAYQYGTLVRAIAGCSCAIPLNLQG
jgi:hypothetical protein